MSYTIEQAAKALQSFKASTGLKGAEAVKIFAEQHPEYRESLIVKDLTKPAELKSFQASKSYSDPDSDSKEEFRSIKSTIRKFNDELNSPYSTFSAYRKYETKKELVQKRQRASEILSEVIKEIQEKKGISYREALRIFSVRYPGDVQYLYPNVEEVR